MFCSMQRLDRLALCVYLFTHPLLTHGLDCYVCQDKLDRECTEDKLKAGHTKALYKQTCPGPKPMCVKAVTEVDGYYENIFDEGELDKYYKSVDIHNECKGINLPPGADHMTTPLAVSGGGGATIASVTRAAASGANETEAAAVGGASTEPAERKRREDKVVGPGNNTVAENNTAQEDSSNAQENNIAHSEEHVTSGCEPIKPFPMPTKSQLMQDRRVIFGCGSYADYKEIDVLKRCRKSSDSVVTQFLCTCDGNLCNSAPAVDAIPTSFILLMVALLHLHFTID